MGLYFFCCCCVSAGGGAGVAGADDDGGGLASAGEPTRACFAEDGSLSALASRIAICHICVSESDLEKPGIPVRRIPLAIFQYVTPGSSPVTPLPTRSSGGFGYMPLATAVFGDSGMPWHTAQCCL